MKVSKKLIIGFLIVAILTAIVGVVGIIGMLQINQGASGMYNNQTVPMAYMTTIVEMIQRERACMREFIIGAAVNDIDLIEDAYNRSTNYRETMGQYKTMYRDTINTATPAGREALSLFDEATRLYDTSFSDCVNYIHQGALAGEDPAVLYELMRTYTSDINTVTDNFEKVLSAKIQVASDANTTGDSLFTTLLIVIILVLALALVIAMFLGVYISRLISKPLITLHAFMSKAGSTGDITLSPEDKRIIGEFSKIKDEIGQSIAASASFVDHVTNIARELEVISGGDLSRDIKPLSDSDTMGKSLQDMVGSLNNMFSEINSSTAQVSVGSKQIADGAQSLAQGSTQQAASVQELSASISEISKKTKVNAEMAHKASALAGTIKDNAEKGSRQMDEMMVAVNDINQASQSISKVIKVIDDIAFQTNILALNAAVEAARAGQHGKGFAVVAEEVRNLAAKSAEAAKDTGILIADSMEKAVLGSRIAGETSESLAEIVSGINESSQIVTEIALSSEVQSSDISQINNGIDQVAQVVQQNSATAEESAAASEEMSGQSDMLEKMIAQFKLKESGGMYRSLPSKSAPAANQFDAPKKPAYDYPEGSGDFGKY